MDKIDRKILRLLQEDASLTNQALAEQVGLSPSPCLRRVQALRDAGIIQRSVAILDAKKIGVGFIAFVEVRLEKQAEPFSAKFEAAILKRREVLDCVFVAGEFDYLLKIAVADMEAFHLFLTQVLTRMAGVANTRSIIPVKWVKQTTALEISD